MFIAGEMRRPLQQLLLQADAWNVPTVLNWCLIACISECGFFFSSPLDNQWLHFVISIKPFPILPPLASSGTEATLCGNLFNWSSNTLIWGSICSPAAPCNLFASICAEGRWITGERVLFGFQLPTKYCQTKMHTHTHALTLNVNQFKSDKSFSLVFRFFLFSWATLLFAFELWTFKSP